MSRPGRLKTSAITLLITAGMALQASAQANPNNSAQNAYVGSVQAVAATPDVMQLSLDDAIRLGIENNLALTLAKDNQKTAEAQKLQLANALLPNASLHAEHGVHQVD